MACLKGWPAAVFYPLGHPPLYTMLGPSARKVPGMLVATLTLSTFKHHQGVSMPLERPFVYVLKFPFYANVCMLQLSLPPPSLPEIEAFPTDLNSGNTQSSGLPTHRVHGLLGGGHQSIRIKGIAKNDKTTITFY
jgi:hypothetical protein